MSWKCDHYQIMISHYTWLLWGRVKQWCSCHWLTWEQVPFGSSPPWTATFSNIPQPDCSEERTESSSQSQERQQGEKQQELFLLVSYSAIRSQLWAKRCSLICFDGIYLQPVCRPDDHSWLEQKIWIKTRLLWVWGVPEWKWNVNHFGNSVFGLNSGIKIL